MLRDGLTLITEECAKKGVTLTQSEAEKLYHRTGGVPLATVWSVAQMGYGYGVKSVLRRLGEPSADINRFRLPSAPPLLPVDRQIQRLMPVAGWRCLVG